MTEKHTWPSNLGMRCPRNNDDNKKCVSCLAGSMQVFIRKVVEADAEQIKAQQAWAAPCSHTVAMRLILHALSIAWRDSERIKD